MFTAAGRFSAIEAAPTGLDHPPAPDHKPPTQEVFHGYC